MQKHFQQQVLCKKLEYELLLWEVESSNIYNGRKMFFLFQCWSDDRKKRNKLTLRGTHAVGSCSQPWHISLITSPQSSPSKPDLLTVSVFVLYLSSLNKAVGVKKLILIPQWVFELSTSHNYNHNLQIPKVLLKRKNTRHQLIQRCCS